MFKYISGDISAKPSLITLTTVLGNAALSWGFGKDNQIDLNQTISDLKVDSRDGNTVIFLCVLDDGRSFTAQCDTKTYDKLEKVFEVKTATQNNPVPVSQMASSSTPSDPNAAEVAKIAAKNERKEFRKAQETAALAEMREKENRKKADKLATQQAEKDRLEQYDKEGVPYCPKCHSISLSANKKGFGGGKALAGALLTANPLGLLAGTIGKNNIEVTCLKCGHKFKI